MLLASVTQGNVLSMHVVAEGIEARAHVEFLVSIGCPFGQGYYYSQALAPEKFIRLSHVSEVRMRHRGSLRPTR